VVLHTHQTWAVALNMLKDNRLVPASQTAACFHGVPVTGDTVAQVQAPPVNDRHSRAERERLLFEAMMRILDRENPGYAE
jgi:ribulose-5-phosphate 4-epimerase/fuculose-1-phosphate aldolase